MFKIIPEFTVNFITEYLSFTDWISFQKAYLDTYMEKICDQ